MADKKLQIILTAKDKASKEIKGMSKTLGKLKTGAKLAGLAVAALAATMAVKGVQAAVQFESAMSDINTLFDDNGQKVAELETGIKDMLKVMPKSAEDLGASAYAIVSAGITDTAEALKILEAATKLSVAGLGSAEEATTLMVLAQNNFKDSTLSAEEKANVLFKTVRNGITTVAQMSQSFGLLAPLFETVGGTLEEMSAATAALTQVNKSASISQNSLKAGLVAMSKPTAQASGLFKKLGVDTFEALVEQSGGVIAAWGAMQEATEGNTEEFAKAMGSGEALTAVISLLGSQSDSFNSSMASMTDGVNVLDEAFKKQSETTEKQYQLFKNNLNLALMALGSIILPLVNAGIKPLIELFALLTDKLSGLTDVGGGIKTWFEEMIQLIDLKTGLITVLKEEWEKVYVVLQEILMPALEQLFEIFKRHEEELVIIAKMFGVVLVGSLILAIKTLAALIIAGVQVIAWIVEFADWLDKVSQGAILVFGQILDGIINKFKSIVEWAKKAAEAVAKGFGGFSDISGAVLGAPARALGLATGRVVTQPTNALIDESGPEAVIPLNKAGMIGGTTFNITGVFGSDAAEEIGDQIIDKLKNQQAI